MARELYMQTADPQAAAASDDELIQRYYAQGDRAALETLLARHADLAYRMALRVAGNAADAEEAVQRACLEVVRCANRFAQTSSFRTWLVGIVLNSARMLAREERRRRKREEEAVQRREEPPETGEDRAALQRAAVKGVQDLPEHHRLPVWLHYFEGLTFREIATALAQPEGTVRSHASRGLETLRTKLAAAGFAVEAGLLPGVLAAAATEAAPAGLVAALSGLVAQGAALGTTAGSSGGAAAGAKATLLGGIAMKTGMTVVAVCALAGGAYMVTGQDTGKPQPPAPPLVAAAPAAPAQGPASESAGIAGWRGDWTGRWPAAQPPLSWGRYNKEVQDHRSQAEKPKGAQPENDHPLALGALREWLVAGPYDVKDPAQELDEAHFAETEVQPAAGEKAGAALWQAWTGTGAKMATCNNYGGVGVNFSRLFGAVENKNAYAHTYLYSPAGGAYVLNFGTWQSTRVWVNGQLACPRVTTQQHAPQTVDVTLKAGWNRVLVKSFWGKGKLDGEWNAWKFSVALKSKGKPAYETKNIQWMKELPASSISAPIIVGDRIYLTADPYYVGCFNKADGKCLWLRSMSFFDMLTPEQKKAIPDFEAKAAPVLAEMSAALAAYVNGDGSKLDPAEKKIMAAFKEVDAKHANKLNSWEQSQPGWTVTPCSDGKRLYVFSQTGAVACYELDGKLVWSRQEEFPGNRHHGYSISPVLAGGKFITMQNAIKAYDASTGADAWTVKGATLTWGSLVPVKANGQDAVFSTEGTLVAVADGKVLWGPAKLGSSIVPTPVTDGADTIFAHSSGKGIAAYKLPGMQQVWTENGPKVESGTGWAGAASASPLHHDGLLYNVTMTGVLICRDAKTGALVYSHELDLAPTMGYVTTPGISASLSLAGKYLYVTDNTFVALVFEPGRTFKQVAKNVIQMEGEGQVWCYPVFDANRLYYRAPKYLYCIGEK